MTERSKEIISGILTIIFVLPLAFGAIVVMGMVIEGFATHSEQLDRCKRQAVTPYEYHQCR